MSKTINNHNLLTSRANLRAHRHVRSQQTNQAIHQILPQTPESEIPLERHRKIVKCFQTFQWKYDIDAHSPLWKRLFHKHVYLRFVRWCWDKLGFVLPEAIIPPSANLPEGALLIKEWQGCFSEQWAAEQEASRHLHGGYTEVAFNWSETAATTTQRSVCSTSSVDKKRYGKRNWEFESALEMLQDTLVQTRPQTEAFPTLRK